MNKNTAEYAGSRTEEFDDASTSERYQPKEKHPEVVDFRLQHDPEFREKFKETQSELLDSATLYKEYAKRAFTDRTHYSTDHGIERPEHKWGDAASGNPVVDATAQALGWRFRLELLDRINSPEDRYKKLDIKRLERGVDLTNELQGVNDTSSLTHMTPECHTIPNTLGQAEQKLIESAGSFNDTAEQTATDARNHFQQQTQTEHRNPYYNEPLEAARVSL